MVLFPSSTQSRISATDRSTQNEGRGSSMPLLLGALDGRRTERAGGLDQLLNGRLILSAGLQQIDADGAAQRNQRVRRVGVELLQTRDELEAGDFSGARAGALFLRGQTGASAVRTGGDVDLVERFEIALRIADRPEELFSAAQLHPLFAVRRGSDLRGRGVDGAGQNDQEESDGNVFHRQPFADAELGTGSDSIKRLLDRTLDLHAVALDVGCDLDERQRCLQLALRLVIAAVLVERDRIVVVVLLFARADGARFLEG